MWRESPGRRNCRDGTHGEAVSPIVVVPVPIAGIEVQVTTVGSAVGRGRPIVAVRSNVAQGTRTVVTITGSRKWSGFLAV